MTNTGITPTGFVKKTYPDIIEDYRTIAEQVFNEPLDLNEYTPQGQLIQIFAYQNALLWDMMEAIYYSGYIATASGDSLDNVIATLGLFRLPALHSTGTITAYGAPNTKIPAKTKIVDENYFFEFETDYSVTIPGSGEIEIPITSTATGYAQNAPAGSLTKALPPTSHYTIYNNSSTQNGRDKETDTDFRNRATIGATNIAYATKEGILTAVLAHPSIEYANIEEDDPNNTFELIYAGTASEETIQSLIESRKSLGITYTITQLSDAIIDVFASFVSDNPQYDITLINSANEAIQSYLSPKEISTTLTWAGLYRHLTKHVDHLEDIISMELHSSEHETPISTFGTNFEISSGLRFKLGTPTLWIKDQTNLVTITLIADSDTLTPEQIGTLLETTLTTTINAHPLGIPINWTDIYTTITELEDITDLYYLAITGPLTTITHPGTDITSASNFKFLPNTITSTASVAIPVSAQLKLIAKESPLLPSIPEAKTPITNLIWDLAEDTALTHTNLQSIITAIETSSSEIDELYTFTVTDGSTTITPSAGTIACAEGNIITNGTHEIITGFKTNISIASYVERSSPSNNIATIQAAINSTLTTHFKTLMPGTTLLWNDINNLIQTVTNVSQTLDLSIHSDTNPYGITTPDSALLIQSTNFAIPTTININVVDTMPVSVTISVTKTEESITLLQLQSYITSKITGYLYSLNTPATTTLSWSGMRSAILYETEQIASIDTLSITVNTSTLTTSEHTYTIGSTEYLIPGTYTITETE